MSDLNSSFVNAERRFSPGKKQRRRDAGQSRFPKPVQDKLRKLLLSHDRPSMTKLMSELQDFCTVKSLPCPSRSSIYNFAKYMRGNLYKPMDLPDDIRASLYNLDHETPVPGHQLVYYAFHYGTLSAISQASGLPWIDLYQASLLPAWRPRSKGLLLAVMRSRGMV